VQVNWLIKAFEGEEGDRSFFTAANLIMHTLLERLPCPLPPPSGSSQPAAHSAIPASPWEPRDSAAGPGLCPWRMGPCSLAQQRALLQDLRSLVTAFFRLPDAARFSARTRDEFERGIAMGHRAVLAAAAAVMADAVLRVDPTTLPALAGIAPPPPPAAGEPSTSLLTDVMNGVATWRLSGTSPKPLGMTLRAYDGAVPFTALLRTQELSSPALLRARAAVVA
jgi:hypothetical protein